MECRLLQMSWIHSHRTGTGVRARRRRKRPAIGRSPGTGDEIGPTPRESTDSGGPRRSGALWPPPLRSNDHPSLPSHDVPLGREVHGPLAPPSFRSPRQLASRCAAPRFVPRAAHSRTLENRTFPHARCRMTGAGRSPVATSWNIRSSSRQYIRPALAKFDRMFSTLSRRTTLWWE